MASAIIGNPRKPMANPSFELPDSTAATTIAIKYLDIRGRETGPFDLIACRNVVIYFTEAAKERIFQGLVNALRPGGVLFVGGTEAILRPLSLGLSVMSPGFYRKHVAAGG